MLPPLSACQRTVDPGLSMRAGADPHEATKAGSRRCASRRQSAPPFQPSASQRMRIT